MISHFILYLETIVIEFGATGVFVASFIEELFAPIPSGIVILSAGFSLMEGLPITFSNLLYMYLVVGIPVGLGIAIGSTLWWWLAYHYGEPMIRRFGKYVGINWSDIEKIQKKFEMKKTDEWALFIMRAVPLLPSIIINLVAGLLKMRFWPYFIITFFGITIRAMIIAFAGWQLGHFYRRYADLVDQFENVVFIAIIVAVVTWLVFRNKRKPKKTLGQ